MSRTDTLVSLFDSVITSPTSTHVSKIISETCNLKLDAHSLANAVSLFLKVLKPPAPSDRLALFRSVVDGLLSSGALSNEVLLDALDQEALVILDPQAKHAFEEKRARTRMWFTQTRYHLFREQSEGYSKMVSLLYDCIRRPEEMSVDAAVPKCMQLISRFNLTFNKVTELVIGAAAEYMDPLLSRSASMPIDHRLPSHLSSLLAAFPENHISTVVGAMLQLFHTPGKAAEVSTAGVEAQVSEVEQPTPAALLATVAVLIREGYMTVADVWGYMSPMDNQVFDNRFVEFEKYLLELSREVSSSKLGKRDSKNERLKAAPNGHGASDRDVFSKYAFVDAGPLPRFVSQKLQFINMLVGLGRWDDAISAILLLQVGSVQIDIAAHPDMAYTLTSLAEVLLQPLFHKTHPSLYHHAESVTEALHQLGGRENRCPVPLDTVEQLVSADPDGPGAVVRQILTVLGPHARHSPRLLFALCRVLKGRKEKEAIDIMREVILPAFSLLQSNTGLANAIWDVLKELPHTTRWKLYGYLQDDVTKTCAVYKVVADRASYEMKYILKRITTDNAGSFLTSVAKLTTGQALPAFNATLDRVQGYPADTVTISPVIEACRNCTNLAIDMLLYLLLDRMANSERNRLKEDGVNTAQWYATLSLFLGIGLRKLPVTSQQIDAVLEFLYTKLVVCEEALLMTALSDIIRCVSDIEMDVNITTRQAKAKGGGKYLQEVVSGVWDSLQPDPQSVGKTIDFKTERERRVSTLALQKAFERSGLHGPIALVLGQFIKSTIYQEEVRSMPVKLGANIVDMARTTLVQLCKFLDFSPVGVREPILDRKKLWQPLCAFGMTKMITELNIPTFAAVEMMGPSLSFLDDEGNSSSMAGSTSTSKDRSNEVSKGNLSKKDDAMEVDAKLDRDQPDAFEFSNVIAEKTKGALSAYLIRSFWTLRLSDISVPVDLYDSEAKRLLVVKGTWEKQVDMFRRHGDPERTNRSDMELRRIREYTEQLQKEREIVLRRKCRVRETLSSNREKFSAASENDTKATVIAFIQECVLPKCKNSAPDAIFCARFVEMLLELDVPAMVYTEYFEIFLQIVPLSLRGCSENEALGLSVLVREVLGTLEKWRSNRKAFEAQASDKKTNGFRERTGGDNTKPMRHERFCQWLFDIHDRLTDGLLIVLKSNEYLHQRNSLSLLASVIDVYPKVGEHASKIEVQVKELSQSKLEDLRLVSNGVRARLQGGKAKRLPKHIFTLRPSAAVTDARSQQSLSSNGKVENKETHGPTKPARLATNTANGERSEAGANASGPDASSTAKAPVVKQEAMKLNPNAKEFVPKPHGNDRKDGTSSSSGKRSRDDDTGGSLGGAKDDRTDGPPPSKRPRPHDRLPSTVRGSNIDRRDDATKSSTRDGYSDRRGAADKPGAKRGDMNSRSPSDRSASGGKPPSSSDYGYGRDGSRAAAAKHESTLRPVGSKDGGRDDRKLQHQDGRKKGGERMVDAARTATGSGRSMAPKRGATEDPKRGGIKNEPRRVMDNDKREFGRSNNGADRNDVGGKGAHSSRRDMRKRDNGGRDREGRSPRESLRAESDGIRRRDHMGRYEYGNGNNGRGVHHGEYNRGPDRGQMDGKGPGEHGRDGGQDSSAMKRRREYGQARGGYYDGDGHRGKRSRVDDGRYGRSGGQREYSGVGPAPGWIEERRAEERRRDGRDGGVAPVGWQPRAERDFERRRDEREDAYDRRDDRGRGDRRDRRNRANAARSSRR
ncbi:THO complex subunit 2 [Gracilaria domingensis]|nr:THO complex subunit 2 [Gracilaria domingensis]